MVKYIFDEKYHKNMIDEKELTPDERSVLGYIPNEPMYIGVIETRARNRRGMSEEEVADILKTLEWNGYIRDIGSSYPNKYYERSH